MWGGCGFSGRRGRDVRDRFHHMNAARYWAISHMNSGDDKFLHAFRGQQTMLITPTLRIDGKDGGIIPECSKNLIIGANWLSKSTADSDSVGGSRPFKVRQAGSEPEDQGVGG